MRLERSGAVQDQTIELWVGWFGAKVIVRWSRWPWPYETFKVRRRFGVDFWEREMLGRRLDWKRRYGFDATWSTTIPYMPRKPPESTI